VSGQIPGSKASQIYKDKAINWTPGTMVNLRFWVREGGKREEGEEKRGRERGR
jgi:hypothetical protein